MRRLGYALVVSLLLHVGCDDRAETPDTTVSDSTTGDAAPDAAELDAAVPDAALADAALADAALDAATFDAAQPDAALPDAALPDAALPDAALPDAALPDAALPDAALPDAALPDAAISRPPEIITASALYDAFQGRLELRLTAADPDGDLALWSVQPKTVDGQNIGPPRTYAPDWSLNGGQERRLMDLVGDVQTVELQLTDEAGLAALVELPVTAPAVRPDGAPCDPLELQDRCAAPAVCINTCQPGTRPTLEESFLHLNPARQSVRIDAFGADAAHDVVTLGVALIDADGHSWRAEGLFFDRLLQGAGPVTGHVTLVGGGEFPTVRFDRCREASNDALNRCAAQGDIGACFDAPEVTNAFSDCQTAAFETARTARVWLTDAQGVSSAQIDAAILAPNVLPQNTPCDPTGASNVCADGLRCLERDTHRCLPVVAECPEGFVTVPSGAPIDGVWTIVASNADRPVQGGGGSCGGGGPTAPVVFTAPAAGTYSFEVTATDAADPEDGDTILYIRSHCGLREAAFELGCNDDLHDETFLSGLSLELVAGQTIYVYVDGYLGEFAGEYTLRISR